jgi:anti-sigma-K factor RskA
MTEGDDIEMLAAEYALGTLDAAERAAVAARRGREPALDSAIAAWEQRLSPLAETVAEVTPPAGLLGAIESRLDADVAFGGMSSVVSLAEVADLRRRLARWRTAAIGAGAIAAALALTMGVSEILMPRPPSNLVAVFQKDDQSPAFVMSVDLEARMLTVRMVSANRPDPDKTYQLWIASDRLGPAPRSLGLIDRDDFTVRRALEYDPGLLRTATFGVSLEPAGGSPTGRPTSPAIHSKLINLKP